MNSIIGKFEESGVPWIGSVPAHWSVNKVGYFYEVQLGKMVQPNKKSETDKLVPYLKAVNVQDYGLKYDGENKMYASSTDLAKYDVEKGDLLVCEGGEIGRSALVDKEYKGFVFQNSLHRVRSIFNNVQFLHYIMQAIRNSGYIDVLVNRLTIAHLTRERLIGIKIAIPNKNEQDLIVQFLNQKTSEIDSLIADKEKLIELLEEKRQAVITEAVTKGLDPEALMKDSGVEWIGEIPEHWTKTKLKYHGKSIIGLTYSPNDIVSSREGNLVLRSNNIQDGKIFTDDIDKNVYVSMKIPSQLRIKSGDILICSRNGSRKLIGKSGYAKLKHEGHSFGAFTTVYRSEQNKFIYYIFMSNLFQSQIGTYLTSTINQLTVSNLNNLQIALPPVSEQNLIVDYLDNYVENSDFVISKERELIDKLKEYRQSLIYEAVTGKMDVQEMEREINQEEVPSS